MTSTQKSRTTKARLSRSIGLSALILAVSGGVAFAQAVVVHGNRRVDAETIRSYAAGRENPQEIRESLLATGLFSNVQVSRRGGREKNEDRMGYCYTRESALLALADGMGGHPDGEVAAQIALQTISAMFQRQAKPKLPDAREFLSEALLAAHHQILRYASDKGMPDSPRTTPDECVAAQVTAVCAALDFALAHAH